ncbi:signal peptide peptidase SppA [Pueribacillus sp. YX66]|uniref:signal peptide peptidase SppA n=1 Tax=Pueribacillus sp. YX66 TaxID=3229242 RepID=UPI00358D17F3
MNAKRWAALGIAAGIFIVSFMVKFAFSLAFGEFASFQQSLFAMDEYEVTERTIEPGTSFDRVAIIEVNGVIQDLGASPLLAQAGYHHRLTLNMLEQAAEDDSVKGIILRVNSPGGGVVESAEIYKKVQALITTEKPVYVSMGSMAASGGYYISAPATKIFANPTTMTGSLGVIMETINYSDLAENIGIDFETIKSGPYKDIGSGSRNMTKKEREILQSMVDNAYNDFVKIIAEGRNMSKEQVKKVADGRIYDGYQAKDVGLIDELGDIDDTIAAIKEEIGNENLGVIQYESAFGFGSFFQMTAQKMFSSEFDLLGIRQLISTSNSPRLMYLYAE